MVKAPEVIRRNESLYKWALLAGAIVVLEATGSETLTRGVRKALATPVGKVAVPAAIAYTTAHFYDKLPHEPIETDAYYLLGRLAAFNRKEGDGTV